MQPTLKEINSWYKTKWAKVTLVAELNNKIIGCMEYTSQGIIGIPGVLEEYRRQRIGSTLLYYLLSYMKQEKFSEAIALYKKFGFDLSRELWSWVKFLKK